VAHVFAAAPAVAPSTPHVNPPPWIVDESWLAAHPLARTGPQLRPAKPRPALEPAAPEPVALLSSPSCIEVVLSAEAEQLIAIAIAASLARDGCEVSGGLFGSRHGSVIHIGAARAAALQRRPASMLPDVGALYDEGRFLERNGFSAREQGFWHTHGPGCSAEPSDADLDFGVRARDVLGLAEYTLMVVTPGSPLYVPEDPSWRTPAYAAWVVSRDPDGRAVCQRAAVISRTGGKFRARVRRRS
jgi:hypothetical protein